MLRNLLAIKKLSIIEIKFTRKEIKVLNKINKYNITL